MFVQKSVFWAASGPHQDHSNQGGDQGQEEVMEIEISKCLS